MKFREILFWLHLCAGCAAGAVILLMSVTGLLLTYEKQMLAWMERGPAQAAPPPGAPRMAAADLIEAVERQRGPLPPNATLTLRAAANEPAEIRAGRDTVIFADPYSGAIRREGGHQQARTVVRKLVAWHRWLGVEGEGRATAKAITGTCNLSFLVLIVTGAYLWIPRRWSWPSVRAVALFRPHLTGKARDFNWHNVFGLWAAIPLFFVVLTALPMSYSWANNLVYRLTGSEPPRPAPRQPAPARVNTVPLGRESVNALWRKAVADSNGWVSVTAPVRMPEGKPAAFTIDSGTGAQPQRRATLLLDPASTSLIRRNTFENESAGRRLRMWTRFVHTGEYYGVLGQTIAGAASAAGILLVWTGIALALRRLAAWSGRRRNRVAPTEAPEATVTTSGD